MSRVEIASLIMEERVARVIGMRRERFDILSLVLRNGISLEIFVMRDVKRI